MNPQVEGARQGATAARDRFLKLLAAVPDDKLNWSPSPSAKSALQVAAHAAVSYRAFGAILRGDPLPATTVEEIRAHSSAEEAKLRTRQDVVAAIEAGSEEVDAAIAGLSEERLGSTVKMPMFEAPMSFFIALPAVHLYGHGGQIEYLQTIWGDTDFHF